MPQTKPAEYSQAQILLHWLVVGLVGVQILIADGMSTAFDTLEKTGVAEPTLLSNLHIFLGLSVFVAVAVRLSLRLTRGVPPAPDAGPSLMHKAGQAAHLAFYVLLIALPITGAVAWFRASGAAADVHEVLKTLLLALIVLHVAAALYHQFVLKTGLLGRMRPGQPGQR